MLTAKEELAHLAETLIEAEAEKVLATIRREHPELYGEPKRYSVIRADSREVRVTVPQ